MAPSQLSPGWLPCSLRVTSKGFHLCLGPQQQKHWLAPQMMPSSYNRCRLQWAAGMSWQSNNRHHQLLQAYHCHPHRLQQSCRHCVQSWHCHSHHPCHQPCHRHFQHRRQLQLHQACFHHCQHHCYCRHQSILILAAATALYATVNTATTTSFLQLAAATAQAIVDATTTSPSFTAATINSPGSANSDVGTGPTLCPPAVLPKEPTEVSTSSSSGAYQETRLVVLAKTCSAPQVQDSRPAALSQPADYPSSFNYLLGQVQCLDGPIDDLLREQHEATEAAFSALKREYERKALECTVPKRQVAVLEGEMGFEASGHHIPRQTIVGHLQ